MFILRFVTYTVVVFIITSLGMYFLSIYFPDTVQFDRDLFYIMSGISVILSFYAAGDEVE